MAFSNIDSADIKLGKFLQIVFSAGVMNQISEDHRDWEMVMKNRVNDPDGRERRFLFQKTYGTAAVQYNTPGVSGSSFPASQQMTVEEHSAVYKEVNATVEIEYNLWNRARKSPAKYAEPLALEFVSKTIATKRRFAADLYGDGTGVVGQVASSAVSNGKLVVTLASGSAALGHIGFFEFGDLLVSRDSAGAADAPTLSSGTFSHWRIDDRSRGRTLADADTVTLAAVLDTGADGVVTAAGAVDSNTLFYRAFQPTGGASALDRSAITDFGTATEVMAGLESLASADGRTIHGIQMSGANAATVLDANGDAFDSSLIQQGLSQTKLRVGEGKYSWKMLCMAPEAQDSLIEARETDRRFHTVEDNKRGVRFWAYQHGGDTLETYTSEFIPKKRVWALPEAKAASKKVLEFHGTDFEPVSANGGDKFHLKPSGSGHQRVISSYLEAYALLICNHPAAILQIKNFS